MVEKRKSPTALKRKTAKGKDVFIVLPDGRKLVKPKAGGKFSKTQIRAAVRKVVSQRKATA